MCSPTRHCMKLFTRCTKENAPVSGAHEATTGRAYLLAFESENEHLLWFLDLLKVFTPSLLSLLSFYFLPSLFCFRFCLLLWPEMLLFYHFHSFWWIYNSLNLLYASYSHSADIFLGGGKVPQAKGYQDPNRRCTRQRLVGETAEWHGLTKSFQTYSGILLENNFLRERNLKFA